MKKAIIGLAIVIIILPFMAVNLTHETTHETKKATTTTTHETTQADTSNNNGNNTPIKHNDNNDNDNNNTKECNHKWINDSYTTNWGLYEGRICTRCGEGCYHLIDTETKTDGNKPTPTTDTTTTPTTDTEKINYNISKTEYNNALYDYEIENGLYCEAREHYNENGNHIETNCNYTGGNE